MSLFSLVSQYLGLSLPMSLHDIGNNNNIGVNLLVHCPGISYYVWFVGALITYYVCFVTPVFLIMYASLSLYFLLCMLRYPCISYYVCFVIPVFRIMYASLSLYVPVCMLHYSCISYFVLCMIRCPGISYIRPGI